MTFLLAPPTGIVAFLFFERFFLWCTLSLGVAPSAGAGAGTGAAVEVVDVVDVVDVVCSLGLSSVSSLS